MDIIFHGRHDEAEAVEALVGILRLFKDRYRIEQFREMRLSLTLVDAGGGDVELVDTETNQAYRIIEIYRQAQESLREQGRPSLKLVIDNSQ